MILAALTFTIASATFKPNATMPLRSVYGKCGGGNISPELHWQGAPKGTRAFAIVAHDPDAQAPGGWYHWIAYNLPATAHTLSEHQQLPDNELGKNSFEDIGYSGPCPPPGSPHHYNFTLYALDAPVSGDHLTGPQLEAAIAQHTLARATVTGMYGR